MKAYPWWIDYWNRQVKKFTIYDVKLGEGAAMAFAFILAKFFPAILDLSFWWFVAAIVVCTARPWYVVLFKKS